jgi:hypothetical protein
MNRIAQKNEAEIIKAMHGLCDAIGALAKVRDALERDETMNRDTQSILLATTKVCTHLVEAGADVPNEFWTIMVTNSVGAEEIQIRLKALLEAA